MKSIYLAFALISFTAYADNYVNGYQRKDGTYVQGHYKTESNNTRNDNYSTQGNLNPYTGSHGTKPRDNYDNSYGSRKPSKSGW